jgi:hypothetical protein
VPSTCWGTKLPGPPLLNGGVHFQIKGWARMNFKIFKYEDDFKILKKYLEHYTGIYLIKTTGIRLK